MKARPDKTQEAQVRSKTSKAKSPKKPASSTFQFTDNRPEAVVQIKWQELANNSPQVQQLAQLQKKANEYTAKQKAENKTGLPDNLKAGVERLSGLVMDDVKVHYNSDKPVQFNAHAYAQGMDIYMAPGQEKHLPHEAWHVVQQKQGRVKPTTQMKGLATQPRAGVNINDDAGLEKEADAMGARALQVKPVDDTSRATKGSVAQKKEMNDTNSLGGYGVVQRTEIDAIAYVNQKGLWRKGFKPHNWLIILLAELHSCKSKEYDTVYEILINNLPEHPSPGRDGYDPPTVLEVDNALKEEITRLETEKIERDFAGSCTVGFMHKHIRASESSAIEQGQKRLTEGKVPANTVLILTPAEKHEVLESLEQARCERWDFIYINCGKAIHMSMGGVERLYSVNVTIGLDANYKLHHLYGGSIKFQREEDLRNTNKVKLF